MNHIGDGRRKLLTAALYAIGALAQADQTQEKTMSTIYRLVLCGLCCLAITCLTDTVDAQRPGRGSGRGGERPGEPEPRRGGGDSPQAVIGSSSVSQGNDPKSDSEDLLEPGDLSKFRGYKEEAIGDGWSVEENILHFDGSKSGDIVTVEEYDNFELTFDWKVSPGGNSGVMYRVSLGDDAPYLSGPEYQVLDDTSHKDGDSALTSAGSLYALYPPSDEKKRKAGVWNKSKIIINGNKVTHFLNNKKVVDVEMGSDDWQKRVADSKFKNWEKFGKNSTGHIAFQDHGNEVWYRNIKIKRLDESGEAEGAEDKPTRRGDDRGRQMRGGEVPAEGNPDRRRGGSIQEIGPAEMEASGNKGGEVGEVRGKKGG